MPYKSKAQQKLFHAALDRGEIAADTVAKFDQQTKKQKGGFKALPEHVKPGSTTGARDQVSHTSLPFHPVWRRPG